MRDPIIIPSAKALIFRGNKFLVLKQNRSDSFYWDLPGGKIEYGESAEETLLREVKEETSLDAEIVKISGVWWFLSQAHKDQVVCITYLCKAVEKKVDLSKNPAAENIVDYKWVTKEEFLNGEFNNGNKSFIEFILTLDI